MCSQATAQPSDYILQVQAAFKSSLESLNTYTGARRTYPWEGIALKRYDSPTKIKQTAIILYRSARDSKPFEYGTYRKSSYSEFLALLDGFGVWAPKSRLSAESP